MKKNELRVFMALLDGAKKKSEIAKSLRMDNAIVWKVADSLKSGGWVCESETKKVSVSDSKKAALLADLLKRKPWMKTVLENNLPILSALLESKTRQEIEIVTGLSQNQISKKIAHLMSKGVLKEADGVWLADEELRALVKATHTYGNVLWENEERIAYSEEGTPTGFAAYADFGLQLQTPKVLKANPPKDLSPEEIFVHSLLEAESIRDRALAALFLYKLRNRLSFHKVRMLCIRYNKKKEFEDLLAFLGGRKETINRETFNRAAETYGVRAGHAYFEETWLKVLQEAGERVLHTDAYLIGGGALTIMGIKRTTKDVDVIVPKGVDSFQHALEALGYAVRLAVKEPGYDRLKALWMEMADAPRFDIFTNRIADGLVFTPTMKKRAVLYKKFSNLKVYYLAPEDILLFKLVAGRPTDLEDCRDLTERFELDWKTILEESKIQEQKTGQFWSFVLLDTLEQLEAEYGLKLPIRRDFEKMCLRRGISVLLKERPKTTQELAEELQTPVAKIRQIVNSMRLDGALERKESGNRYVYSICRARTRPA